MGEKRCGYLDLTLRLEESYESEGLVSVVLSNCEVKRGRRGEQLEVSCCVFIHGPNVQVLMTKNTGVDKSDKVFEAVAELSASSESGSAIKLDEVKNLVAFQSVRGSGS